MCLFNGPEKKELKECFRRKSMDIEKAASSKIISIEDAISILLCKHCFEDFQFYYVDIHIDVIVERNKRNLILLIKIYAVIMRLFLFFAYVTAPKKYPFSIPISTQCFLVGLELFYLLYLLIPYFFVQCFAGRR
jgi:hypothetical protein